MNLWSDVLEIWKNFSPFLHRTLLTLGEMLEWAKISINYLGLHFRSELSNLFPENIELDDNGWMFKSSKKYFEDLFKEGVSNRKLLCTKTSKSYFYVLNRRIHVKRT